MSTLVELQGRMGVLLKRAGEIQAAHPDGLYPDDIKSETQQILAELPDLKAKITEAKNNREGLKGLADYKEFLDQPALNFPVNGKSGDDDSEREAKDRGRSQHAREREARKTIAQMVLNDDKYQKWYAETAPEGYFSKQVKVTSPQIMIPGGVKALVTGTADASAGAFIFNDVQRNLDQYIRRRPLVMRDIITIGQTDSDTVEYVQQISETNNAAMVPEAQSTAPIGDGTGGTTTAALGGLKPESAMVFGRVTANVKTVAHWMPATKRALADAGQMQTLIDGFLRYGIDEELEDQMVLGNGVGENFTGLANISGLTAQAWDTNAIVTTRRARTKVRIAGRARPTAYLLNPLDWEDIQLSRTNEGGANTGAFLFGGPAASEVPTLWGLPVVESESVPVGTGYVGDFNMLILWDRQQTSVQMTDSHADFFVRNLVAILAEARAAFGCLRPSAIVEMDLTP